MIDFSDHNNEKDLCFVVTCHVYSTQCNVEELSSYRASFTFEICLIFLLQSLTCRAEQWFQH